ncbi:HEAT repeat domain-containing protein [candidate division CSSED10-310 bacterium]|uniref:HEAT repeat domain-containing protein n=1 Tax=candidate division CSSED10-310 bacterium TaxID=2855610 RepID=A0ABV6Z4L6_UNCC1
MMSFIKAISHSGYYAPDHPSAKKAFEGLYEQFLVLVGDYPELTYYRIDSEDGPDIFIEGIVSEALRMSKFMSQLSGELFIPRLSQFFVRKKLLSFTLKKEITESEFRQFIVILSMAPEADGQQKTTDKENLNVKLAEAGVINVSLSFEEDLVGRERKLPWRVEMALTRLKRDLRYLPLYKDFNEEHIAQAKVKVLQDIIRPLRRPNILKEFLISCDLIDFDRSLLEIDTLDEIIISVIPTELTTPVIKEILKDWETFEKRKSGGDQNVIYMFNRIEEVTRKLAKTFKKSHDKSDFEAIMFLYIKNIISFSELPNELRDEILLKEWLQEFYFSAEELFARIRQEKDITYFTVELRKISALIPGLIDQQDLESVITIIDFLEELLIKCSDSFGERSKTLRQILSEIPAHPAFFERLKQFYLEADNDTRQKIDQIFHHFKKEATPTIFAILERTDKKSVHKNALDLLIQFKHEVIPFIKKILKDEQTHWCNFRNAINVLRGIGDKRLSSDIVPFLDHPEGRVRQSALNAIAKLMKHEGLPYLKNSLQDPELDIRKRAVTLIVKLGLIDPELLLFFGKYLLAFQPKGDQEFEKFQIHIMRTIAILPYHLKWNDSETIEDLLWGIYDQAKMTSKIKRLLSKRDVHSPQYLEVLTETLKKVSKNQIKLQLLE